MRGCQICDTVIPGVATGRSNTTVFMSGPVSQNERGARPIRSDRDATAITVGKLGTMMLIRRARPNSARASSTGPVNWPFFDETTWSQAA